MFGWPGFQLTLQGSDYYSAVWMTQFPTSSIKGVRVRERAEAEPKVGREFVRHKVGLRIANVFRTRERWDTYFVQVSVL